MPKPLIGIISNHKDAYCPRKRAYRLLDNVVNAVEAAGGLALILPYEQEAIPQVLDTIDGLLLPGGDISYGSDWYMPGQRSQYKPSKRGAYEINLIQKALDKNMPILGLCLGMQLLGCMFGGRLRVLPKKHGIFKNKHRQEDGSKLVHSIQVMKDTKLEKIMGGNDFEVNSIHCEAIMGIDPIYLSAIADDGVIEAIEAPDKDFVIGVQWHPEYFINESSPHLALFKGLVSAATH